MPMYKIAAVGEPDIVLGFKALGVEVYPLNQPGAVVPLLAELFDSAELGIILVSESMADQVEQLLREIGPRPLPSVLYIPGSKGSRGFAIHRLRSIIEKAVGAAIIAEEEG